jgi:hypothetical protein
VRGKVSAVDLRTMDRHSLASVGTGARATLLMVSRVGADAEAARLVRCAASEAGANGLTVSTQVASVGGLLTEHPIHRRPAPAGRSGIRRVVAFNTAGGLVAGGIGGHRPRA